MTYFAEEDDKAVKEPTLKVIQSDEYDVIVVYQADYDDGLHQTDHGAHIDLSTGKGDHGLDIDEDMNLFRCYGIFTGE